MSQKEIYDIIRAHKKDILFLQTYINEFETDTWTMDYVLSNLYGISKLNLSNNHHQTLFEQYINRFIDRYEANNK